MWHQKNNADSQFVLRCSSYKFDFYSKINRNREEAEILESSVKQVTFLNHEGKPELNSLHAKAVVSARFST